MFHITVLCVLNLMCPTQTLKDWHLVLIALVISAVGTTLAVIQVVVPALQPSPYLAPNHEPPITPVNVSANI